MKWCAWKCNLNVTILVMACSLHTHHCRCQELASTLSDTDMKPYETARVRVKSGVCSRQIICTSVTSTTDLLATYFDSLSGVSITSRYHTEMSLLFLDLKKCVATCVATSIFAPSAPPWLVQQYCTRFWLVQPRETSDGLSPHRVYPRGDSHELN